MLRSIGLISCLLLLAATVLASNAVAAPSIEWPSEASAVAWQAKKKMFMFKTAWPVGMNESIQVDTIRSNRADGTGAPLQVRVRIPIEAFDSGEGSRDEAVRELLKAEQQPEMLFLSKPMSAETLEETLEGNVKTLSGTLNIGGWTHDVEFELSAGGEEDGRYVDGSVKTKFSDFSLERPKIVGGVVANVQDELHLHFRLFVSDLPLPS